MTTILLAEDNTAQRVLFEQFLIYEGFTVQSVITGTALVQAALATPPHLILTDVHLPEITGIEAIRHLRTFPQLDLIPILVQSCDYQSHEAALKAGAQRFLLKPVDLDDLLSLIHILTDRQPETTPYIQGGLI